MEHTILDHTISIGGGIAIFGLAFGAWAWVVGWGVSVVRKEVADLKVQVKNSADANQKHMLDVEHRLTLVEADIRRCSVFSRE